MVKPHSATRTRVVCPLENTLRIRLNDKSRMKGDFHVRFGESLRGRFPWATRLQRLWRGSWVFPEIKMFQDLPVSNILQGDPARIEQESRHSLLFFISHSVITFTYKESTELRSVPLLLSKFCQFCQFCHQDITEVITCFHSERTKSMGADWIRSRLFRQAYTSRSMLHSPSKWCTHTAHFECKHLFNFCYGSVLVLSLARNPLLSQCQDLHGFVAFV